MEWSRRVGWVDMMDYSRDDGNCEHDVKRERGVREENEWEGERNFLSTLVSTCADSAASIFCLHYPTTSSCVVPIHQHY